MGMGEGRGLSLCFRCSRAVGVDKLAFRGFALVYTGFRGVIGLMLLLVSCHVNSAQELYHFPQGCHNKEPLTEWLKLVEMYFLPALEA